MFQETIKSKSKRERQRDKQKRNHNNNNNNDNNNNNNNNNDNNSWTTDWNFNDVNTGKYVINWNYFSHSKLNEHCCYAITIHQSINT